MSQLISWCFVINFRMRLSLTFLGIGIAAEDFYYADRVSQKESRQILD